MLRKAYTPLSLLLKGILLLVTGSLFLSRTEEMMSLTVSLLILLSWLSAADAWIKWVAGQNKSHRTLAKPLLAAGLAIFLSVCSNALPISFSLVYALWMLINALAKFLYGAQLLQTRSRGFVLMLIEGAVYLLFALSLMFFPLDGSLRLGILLGLYCLIRGFFQLVDAGREWLGTDIQGKRVRQRLRLKPPVILTSLIPMSLLRALDDPDEEAEIANWTRQETVMENPAADLEIFLHLSRDTAMGFGHVDIALDGKIYSYGCYDGTSNRLGGILSDGVLVQADRAAYIPHCLKHEKKRLIGYGVVLTAAQKQAIEHKLSAFLAQSTPWLPTEKNPEQLLLQRTADAVFYKIDQGPFKTYNVLTTNCVAVANMLSGSGGVDLMNPQGIITPGTYAEFLDRQFRRPRSIVVSRTVYR